MPELPEVERARRVIEQGALGRRIAAVDDADTYVCRPHAPGELAAALVGRTLTAAHRRGKAMWLETDGGDGPDLGLHLGMAGHIVVDEPPIAGQPDDKTPAHSGEPGWRAGGSRFDRFVLEFEDGGRLALRDRRRLGRAVLEPDISRLGPDAAEISRAAFRARVGAGHAPIKARLLDQHALAGVGNLLADEALWRAKIAPQRETGSLSEEELDRLRVALRAALRDADRLGGVHTGKFIAERRTQTACPRCGGRLARGVVGGRTTWWCANEQV